MSRTSAFPVKAEVFARLPVRFFTPPHSPLEVVMPAAPKPRRLDARSPFVFDVRELGRRPGAMSTFDRDLPAGSLLEGVGDRTLDGLYTTEGADLLLDLRVESVVEGMLATGRVSGSLVGECVRCLDPVEIG